MSIVSDLAELQRIAGNTVGLMYQCYGCGKLMTPDEFASLGGSRHCTPIKLVKRVPDVPIEDREDYKAGVAAGREQCAKIIESVAIQFDKDLQAHEPRERDEGYKWKTPDRERSEREPIAIFAIKISKIIRSGE